MPQALLFGAPDGLAQALCFLPRIQQRIQMLLQIGHRVSAAIAEQQQMQMVADLLVHELRFVARIRRRPAAQLGHFGQVFPGERDCNALRSSFTRQADHGCGPLLPGYSLDRFLP